MKRDSDAPSIAKLEVGTNSTDITRDTIKVMARAEDGVSRNI